MNKGDIIRVMYDYFGKEIESDAIFLGHRDDSYMYADSFQDYCHNEKYLVKIQTPDNKEIIKELDRISSPKEYPEINYCDNLESIITQRINKAKRDAFLEPIFLCQVFLDDNTLTIKDQSFIAEKINGNRIFTNGQLDDIEAALNNIRKNHTNPKINNNNAAIKVKYNWQLCNVFANRETVRDLYVVGNSLCINNNNITYKYDKWVEIARVYRYND